LKKTVVKILKFIIFFTLGIFIFWYHYKDFNFSQLISDLQKVDYFWVIVSLFIGLISHISRTLRWGLMIEPIGHKPRFINTFLAVMVGYLMNFTVPRLGEISRCGVLSRYEKISFTKLFGTVVAERLIDVISLLLLLLLVIFSQFGQMISFLQHNPEIQNKLTSVFTSPFLIVAVVAFIVIAYLFRNTFKQTSIFKKVVAILKNFKEGFISIRSIKRKGWFWFHSAFIWFCYYLMLYSLFFAFDFTRYLNPVAGLTTFVFGSFGMAAPVQGGIGTYHLFVTDALGLYGISRVDGQTFALVAHTSMTLMIIVIGIISILVLPFINRRGDVEEDKTV